MRLVILGGVAAGTKAASRARRLDPEIEITVYQEEPEPSISECGLPYLLSGVVEERDDLVARTPEQFAEKDVEVAENLCRLGMEVSLIEGEARVALAYGPEVSENVEAELEANGVGVYTGEKVDEFTGEARVRGVKFGDSELETDLVIVGVGIRPNVELAAEAGVEIGTTGAILVDPHMKTSVPDVWAAGDCVETTNLVSGRSTWVPLGDTANQMGRVAGTNAATGEETLEFPGILGTGIFKVFDLGVGKTGLSEKEAEDAGFEVVSAGLEAYDRAAYYPGAQKAFLKLIADRATGRLLGAESAGSGADKLTDICAAALWGSLSYPDLVNIDLAYAPPYGPALSPVIQAATVLSGKFDRAREGVRASE